VSEASKHSAMSRTKPSAPFTWLAKHGELVGRILDYGCGYGMDVKSFGVEGYDPNWDVPLPDGDFDTIVCNYVLNVVDEDEQKEILTHIKSLLSAVGRAFIVARRDLKVEGQDGRKGYKQRMVYLPFEKVHHTSGYQIYRMHKHDI